jgi:uncharacterized membrane protein
MTETLPSAAKPHEDRVLPGIVYALYIFGAMSVLLTLFVGLLVAYANRTTAGSRMASHYEFLIQTFWKSIWWFIIGIVAIVVGLVLLATIILSPIGILLMVLGGGILSVITIWFYVRCVVGIIYLVQDEAYPRPDAWLI